MGFKYGQGNLRDSVARAIIEYKVPNKLGDIHHTEIHRRVQRIVGHSISHNKLLKTFSDMTNEGELIRNDPTQGKRGSKVFYALTDKGKKKYRLRILGTDKKIRKRKNLYQLLFFFEVYKRRQLLTKIQLSRFLKQVGSSISELEKVRESQLFDKLPSVFFKPIKGIDIMGLLQHDAKKKSDKVFYYTVLPGFSLEEFVWYLELLKNGIEPRPFTSSHTLIPFVLYTPFRKKEIVKAINIFQDDGLIKRINPIVPGEKRFIISNDGLKHLSYAIWGIRTIDYELLVRRLIHRRSADRDREYLSMYFGKREAYMMLVEAHDIRRLFKKEKQEQAADKEAILNLEQKRELLIQKIEKKYGNTIKENEVMREIMEEVCYSPLFKKES